MSADADIVIVGAGAAGISAARRLAVSGLSSIVLEATAQSEGELGHAMLRVCELIWAADGFIPPTATHGPALPRQPALLDRQAPAWGRQYHHIGFSRAEQAAARRAYAAWEQRMECRRRLAATAPPTRWSQRASGTPIFRR